MLFVVPAGRLVVGIGAVAALGLVAAELVPDRWVGMAAASFALSRLVVAGWRHRRVPRAEILPWALLAAGAAVTAIGEVVRAGSGGYGLPFPSHQDLVAVAGHPLTVAGLLVLIRRRRPGRDVQSLYEAGIYAMAVGFLSWMLALEPLTRTHHVSYLAGVASLGLPMLDVVVLVLAGRLAGVTVDGSSRRLVLAFASQTAFHAALAVTALAGFDPPVFGLTALSLLSFGLWVPAVSRPSVESEPEARVRRASPLSRPHLVVVTGAVLLGPAVFAFDVAGGDIGPVSTLVLGSALLSLLVVGYLARLVQQREAIEHDAWHDDLTGLPNRLLFEHRLRLAVAQASSRGMSPAVMVLDLDRFKNVNDSLGHAAGNRLLEAVGRRLVACVRPGDTVARLGGDEFAVLLPDAGGCDGVEATAQRVLESFRSPIRVLGRRIFMSPSIGLAVHPSHGRDAEGLVKHADTAMWRAKERGGNAFRLYSPEMSASAERRLVLETGLHTAVERNELVVHYQPVVDLATGRIVGIEALLRWDHPELGLLSPDLFIPLAEETGLIVSLGEWALETACAQAREWQVTTGSPLTVAVNLSPRQLQQEGLGRLVTGVLERTGLDPVCLDLEITESLALQDPNVSTLSELRDMGVGCSLDDFGTGYCGLAYLTRFPATKLKIDRSFVEQIGKGEQEALLVVGMIRLAQSLGLQVIAEGIETSDQLDFLRKHGCEEGQGYLFGPPLPAERIGELLDLESGISEAALGLAGAPAAA